MKIILRLLSALSGIKCAQSSGVISLVITKITNSAGYADSGQCCDGSSSRRRICSNQCDTFFRVCFSPYNDEGSCVFGQAETPVLGGNSFENPNDIDLLQADSPFQMKIPFSQSWMYRYHMRLEAMDDDENSLPQLIEATEESKTIRPTGEWVKEVHRGTVATIEYLLKVECDENYYDMSCSTFCEPKNDESGHFSCSSFGEKVCRDGWGGDNCDQPICSEKCHEEHGYCNEAGECRCRHGWTGPFCSECIPAEGCVHGTCELPFECKCTPFWGGKFCDINLNSCESNPCQNESKCENTYGNFTCTCLPGYHGQRCEHQANACVSKPCGSHGVCSATKEGSFTCACKEGWTGPYCSVNINECANAPCKNGGKCIDREGDFLCECPPGWIGKTCQLDVDECSAETNPCQNAQRCINSAGTFFCHCKAGFEGDFCEKEIDECLPEEDGAPKCANGGTCIDAFGSFKCVCPNGFEGDRCEVDIDECAQMPCSNGGRCSDMIGDFKCLCPSGYSGRKCEIPMGFCSDNPCQNEGKCFNVAESYECQCKEEFEGKNCERVKDYCAQPGSSCEVINACETKLTELRTGTTRLLTTKVCGAHGRCVASSFVDYTCECEEGFTGDFCQEEIDNCASDPCKNQGVCLNGINSFECSCPVGFAGLRCEKEAPVCSSSENPCLNNGKCIPGDSGHPSDFTCSCSDGWKGHICQFTKAYTAEEICKNSSPCNAGTCVPDTRLSTGISCECPRGTSGALCQIDARSPCSAKICKNGVCFRSDDGNVECRCKAGFTGAKCDKQIDMCKPEPCFNGGTCLSKENHYECKCRAGFVGADCRKDVDDCANDQCAYGSTCVDKVGGFECLCPPGREGAYCEKLNSFPTKRSCAYKGKLFVHSYSWREQCNTCSCHDGDVSCSKLDCGPIACSPHAPSSCLSDESCQQETPSEYENCVSSRCSRRYTCQKKFNPYTTTESPATSCKTPNCLELKIQFDVNRISSLERGVHAMDVCGALNFLPSLARVAENKETSLNCESAQAGVVVVVVKHQSSAELVVKEIRRALFEKSDLSSVLTYRDEVILSAAYDVSTIDPSSDIDSHWIWYILAFMLGLLSLFAVILLAFMVKHKNGMKSSEHEGSSYTMGSGVTDQVLMAASPSSSTALEPREFVFIDPKEHPYPNMLPRRVPNHLLSHNLSLADLTGPPPPYEESYQELQGQAIYATISSTRTEGALLTSSGQFQAHPVPKRYVQS